MGHIMPLSSRHYCRDGEKKNGGMELHRGERESVKDIERSLEGLDMIEGDPRERRGRSIEVKREERRQGGLLY